MISPSKDTINYIHILCYKIERGRSLRPKFVSSFSLRCLSQIFLNNIMLLLCYCQQLWELGNISKTPAATFPARSSPSRLAQLAHYMQREVQDPVPNLCGFVEIDVWFCPLLKHISIQFQLKNKLYCGNLFFELHFSDSLKFHGQRALTKDLAL